MGNLAPNILKTGEAGKHSDGSGLYLHITGRDDRGRPKGYWFWRYTFHKKRREMGLGSVTELNLKSARESRDAWASWMKRNGTDPLDYKAQQGQDVERRRKALTLDAVAPLAFEAIKDSLKGDANAKRWYSPVRLHLLPALGKMKIEEVHQTDIADALRLLWKDQYPTAKKALDRLNVILGHAAAMGLDVNLSIIPHAKILLGSSRHKVVHHPALPVIEAARLYQSLNPESNVDRALMLYLLIGGGTRLKPLREAHIDQFEGDIWTVPAEHMKGRKGGNADGFRVPLIEEAITLIEMAQEDCTDGFLFSTRSAGRRKAGTVPVVSDQAIENVMRDRETAWHWPAPYRPHGIRATFRSWAAQENPHLFTIAETAIGHKVGSGLERTYQRNDYLEERRALLTSWANHLSGRITSGNILPLNGTKRRS